MAMSATAVLEPARATPRVSRMCILALARVFSEIDEKSVSVTNRASVSVTGGGVAILFSCEMGDMRVQYLIKKATGNRWQTIIRKELRRQKHEWLFEWHQSFGVGQFYFRTLWRDVVGRHGRGSD